MKYPPEIMRVDKDNIYIDVKYLPIDLDTWFMMCHINPYSYTPSSDYKKDIQLPSGYTLYGVFPVESNNDYNLVKISIDKISKV